MLLLIFAWTWWLHIYMWYTMIYMIWYMTQNERYLIYDWPMTYHKWYMIHCIWYVLHGVYRHTDYSKLHTSSSSEKSLRFACSPSKPYRQSQLFWTLSQLDWISWWSSTEFEFTICPKTDQSVSFLNIRAHKGKVEHPTNDMRSMDQWNRFLPRFLLLLQLVLAKDKETLLSSFWSTLQSQHFNSIHFTSDCFHFYCCENLFHPTRSRFVPLAPGEGNQAPERVCCCSFHRACAWRGDAVYIFFCSVVADWNVFTEQRDSRQLCVWVVKHWEEHDESILVA